MSPGNTSGWWFSFMTEHYTVLAPAPRSLWEQFFTDTATAPASLAPGWFDALCAHGGYHPAARLYTFGSGRRLLLPLAARRVLGLAVSLESWPAGLGYGGVLVEGGGEPTRSELDAVLADLARLRAAMVSVTPDPLAGPLWMRSRPPTTPTTPRRSQLIDLSGGIEAVTRGFHSGVRREARKAERRGLEIIRDTDGMLLNEFARLYGNAVRRWADDRGQPAWLATALAKRRDTPGLLTAVRTTCVDELTLWGAMHEGEAAAVYVVMTHRQRAWEWLGAVDFERARETGATALLLATIVEHECTAGRAWLDLGESDAGSGVEERKRRFGAVSFDFPTLHVEQLPIARLERRAREAAVSALARRPRRAAAPAS
jgi:hypothetical protein